MTEGKEIILSEREKNELCAKADNVGKIDKLATALSKAQGVMKSAKKDSSNPYFKSKYADLSSVWEVIRKPLSDNELSIIQLVNGDILDTILAHSSGQFIKSSIAIKSKDNTAQSMGSAITYARRYALSSLVGVVADEDDDGNAASKKEDKGSSKYADVKIIKEDDIDMSPPEVEITQQTEKQKRAEILSKITATKVTPEQLSTVIKKNFGKDKFSDITTAQAKELLKWAEDMSQ